MLDGERGTAALALEQAAQREATPRERVIQLDIELAGALRRAELADKQSEQVMNQVLSAVERIEAQPKPRNR